MSRSILRALAGVALVATIPAVAQAQFNCTRINGVSGGTCALTAAVTIPGLASISSATSSTTFADPDYSLVLGGTLQRSLAPDIVLNVRSNASITATVTPSLGVLPGGSTRAVTDYAFELTTNPACTNTDLGNFTAGANALTLPTGPVNTTRRLCLQADFDPASPSSIVAGAYTLTLTFAISAP